MKSKKKIISYLGQKRNWLLLFLILFIVTLKTQAQETERKRNEVGFNLIDYGNFVIPSNPEKQIFDVNYLNGIYFKQHFEKKSLRIAFEHYNGNIKIDGKGSFDADTLNTVGYWAQNIFSAGIEKNHFVKNNIQLYWGADLNLFYGIYNGQSKSISGLSSYATVKQDKGIGFTPLGGIRFTVSDCIRFSLEANAKSIVFSQVENRQDVIPTSKDNQNQTINFALKYGMAFKLSYIF